MPPVFSAIVFLFDGLVLPRNIDGEIKCLDEVSATL